KAGIMEVGDVFCVNKADLPGADRVRREVRSALDLAPSPPGAWRPPIVATVASTGEGVPGLAQRIADHRAHLAAAGRLAEALRRAWEERQERAVNDILAGRSTPAAEVRRLWATGA